MTYFPDLSPYRFHTFQPELDPKLLNIGWLDRNFPYNRGPVEQHVVEKLLRLGQEPREPNSGYHHCPYGSLGLPSVFPCPCPVRMKVDGKTLGYLGNGEIRGEW